MRKKRRGLDWLSTIPYSTNGLFMKILGGPHSSAEDIFECTFLNENTWISNETALVFPSKHPVDFMSALVQAIIRWRGGDKPLPELSTIKIPYSVTRPPWAKSDDLARDEVLTAFQQFMRASNKFLWNWNLTYFHIELVFDRVFSYSSVWSDEIVPGIWPPFQYPIKHITLISHSVSKPQDLCLELFDRSEIGKKSG